MATVGTSAGSTRRATDLTSKRAVARAFLAEGSPRVILTAVAVAAAVRVGLGSWGIADLVVVGLVVALVGPVEWVLHRYLLHADEDSFRMRVLKTGTGHREHHLDPPAIDWLLLRAVDAAVFLPMIAVFTASWSLPVAGLLGDLSVATYLSALVASWIALAHYEWTHLLVHTGYRCRSRPYARLARHHRFHHYRNERYWLGVTANSGDRLARTLPRSRSEVPLSPTARTLAG